MNDDPKLSLHVTRAAQIYQLLAVGQYERAKELAAQQISDAPDDPSSYVALVSVLMRERNHDGAIAAANRAIELAPEWAGAWRMRATALYQAGRFAESEASIIEAIRLEPDDAGAFTFYARLLHVTGKNEKALELVRIALELDPDDDDAQRLYAALLHEVHPKRWKISEEAARRAIELNPDDADGYAILGLLVMTRRQFDEAEGLFRTALELEPFNQLALRGLAEVVMGKNLFYKPFLGYALLMQRLGDGAQFMVVGSIWAFASVLSRSVKDPASTIITIAYLALCAYTWFATPIMRAILRRNYPWI